MSNIREVLDDLFSQAFNSGSAHQIPDEIEMIDEAELAINKIVLEARKEVQGNYICDYCDKAQSIHYMKFTYDGDAKPNGRICLDCLDAQNKSNMKGE